MVFKPYCLKKFYYLCAKVQLNFELTKYFQQTMVNISKFYFELPKKKRSKFRVKVSNACGWSYGTFYYKLNHGNFSKLERKAIFEIINGYLETNPAVVI